MARLMKGFIAYREPTDAKWCIKCQSCHGAVVNLPEAWNIGLYSDPNPLLTFQREVVPLLDAHRQRHKEQEER